MKVRNILKLITSAIALAAVSFWIGQQAYSWLPPQAAAESILVDDLFSFLVGMGAFIFLGVTGALIYSIVFHRATKYDMSDGPPIEGNITLEIVWTVIPLVLVFWIAVYSYQVYDQMSILGRDEVAHLNIPVGNKSIDRKSIDRKSIDRKSVVHKSVVHKSVNYKPVDTPANQIKTQYLIQPPEKIEVVAKQWAWVFRYPEENITSTELHLPVNQRATLALKSEDVIHGFYIPAFRVKQDVIPLQTIDFEFTPIREGTYRLRDSQYSGTYFAAMQANVVVESQEKYNLWLKEASTHEPSPAPNQAASEFARRTQKSSKSGWVTVVPAEPQEVNYHS